MSKRNLLLVVAVLLVAAWVAIQFPGPSVLAENRPGAYWMPMMGNLQPTGDQWRLMQRMPTPQMQQVMQSMLNGTLTPEQLEKMQDACSKAAREILSETSNPTGVR